MSASALHPRPHHEHPLTPLPRSQACELARNDLIRVLTGRSCDAINWMQDDFHLGLAKVVHLGGHSQPRNGALQGPHHLVFEWVKIQKKVGVRGLVKHESGVRIGAGYDVSSKKGIRREIPHGPVVLVPGGYTAGFTEDFCARSTGPSTPTCPPPPATATKCFLAGVVGLLLDNTDTQFRTGRGQGEWQALDPPHPRWRCIGGDRVAPQALHWPRTREVLRARRRTTTDPGLDLKVLAETFRKHDGSVRTNEDPFRKKASHPPLPCSVL
ncbi:hypothetical protein FIBSPDRAFT_896275 [Athelia psychrophila]|uniref:Uncharacterized protein n=1 Tax=Athelia psychrophila TaxID=1759441 RepID=A0A166DIV9_9AGAM|nr:hypothetical protein FIBSPDRAFT_896275 [Fibularhizoctonia sp. CBS 109695]